jgi:hypothetical protein
MDMLKKILIVGGVVVLAAAWFWHSQERVVQPTPTPTATQQSNQYKDLVVITQPLPGSSIVSPVVIEGRARGNWYFEASFPIVVVNADGATIGQGIAQAQSDWMTTEYVPFRAEITFTKPVTKNNGMIILQKDNPSGLPQYDDAFRVPILFQ